MITVRKYFPNNAPLSADSMIDGYRYGNAMLDSLGAVIFALTLARDALLYISPSAKLLYGETVDALRNHPNFWLEAIHPEDKPAVWVGMDKVRETERGAVEFFYRVVASDGETTWVHHRCQVALSEGGVPIRLDCMVVPCTPAHVTPPKTGFDGMLLPGGDALLLRDPAHDAIVEVNSTAVEMLGYSRSELIGMDFYEVSAQSEGFDARAEQAMLDGAHHGRYQRYEWLVVPKDKAPLWVDVTLSQVHWGGRDLLLASVRDIHAKKLEEERLALATEQLERGRDVVVQANPAGQVIAINPAGRAMLGVSPAAVRDLFIIDLLPNWVQPHFLQTCLPLATKDGLWRGELALANREGRTLPVLLSLTAHKRGGAVKGYSLMAHDIAPYKLKEQRFKRAKETLEADNLFKEKMLENISGGLLRPLDELKQLVQILEKNPLDIDLALPHLKRAVIQANRLASEAASFISAGSKRDLPPR